MKKALCITVFNEEKSIEKLLESVISQTVLPDEILIVDGGSTDTTVAKIRTFQGNNSYLQKRLKLFSCPNTNRPHGRNISIEKSSCEIVAITDAGCELDKQWFDEVTKPFVTADTMVVSGYYAGRPKNALEEALVPYVLVMPDQVIPSLFLPSTRSMAMKKSVWQTLGGFPVEYRWNEDYVFSVRLAKAGIPIVFAPKAIVYWFPRESVLSGWRMFYAFAKGDMQAGIFRRTVRLLVLRMIAAGVLCVLLIHTKSVLLGIFILFLITSYLSWAIAKNYRYMRRPFAPFFLPVWQLTADSAVFVGSLVGLVDRIHRNYIK